MGICNSIKSVHEPLSIVNIKEDINIENNNQKQSRNEKTNQNKEEIDESKKTEKEDNEKHKAESKETDSAGVMETTHSTSTEIGIIKEEIKEEIQEKSNESEIGTLEINDENASSKRERSSQDSLKQNKEKMSKVQIGKTAPSFECDALVETQFKKVKLEDFKGKWLILFFYPMDFTFVCPTEIIEFNKMLPDFRKLNCEVVGASCDSEYVHFAWTQQDRKKGGLGKIDYPLLADKNKELSKNYGVLLNGEVALRGTFIIDPKQIVRQITVNDLSVGRNVQEFMRLLEAFQHFEKHGNVCPVNWSKKNSNTIVPDVEKSLEYFAKTE